MAAVKLLPLQVLEISKSHMGNQAQSIYLDESDGPYCNQETRNCISAEWCNWLNKILVKLMACVFNRGKMRVAEKRDNQEDIFINSVDGNINQQLQEWFTWDSDSLQMFLWLDDCTCEERMDRYVMMIIANLRMMNQMQMARKIYWTRYYNMRRKVINDGPKNRLGKFLYKYCRFTN